MALLAEFTPQISQQRRLSDYEVAKTGTRCAVRPYADLDEVSMAREELLKLLWETAALLDDKQLEKGTELLEALAFPERAAPPPLPNEQLMTELSHVEFIARLRDKLRTSEETF